VTLTFDLLTSHLLSQLLVSMVISPPNLKFLQFEKIVGAVRTEHSDGQTDRVHRLMRPLRVGCIITYKIPFSSIVTPLYPLSFLFPPIQLSSFFPIFSDRGLRWRWVPKLSQRVRVRSAVLDS